VSRLSRIKKTVANNWRLKTIASILAVVAYYAIRGATSYEVVYETPVVVNVDDPGVALLDKDPKSVQITFRGAPEDLRRIDQKQLRVLMRPKPTGPAGYERITLSPRDVEGASGARVERIAPTTVTLFFDRQEEKDVSVQKPVAVGTPLVGHVEIDYTPKTVKITGPRQRLREQDTLTTEPVDVDGRIASFTRKVKVLPPSNTWLAKIKPSEIRVDVRIVTESMEKTLERVPVLVLSDPLAEARRVKPDPADVKLTLSGRADVVEKAAAGTLAAYVDVRGLASGRYELPIRPLLPVVSDLRCELEPKVATVDVDIQKATRND